MRARFTDYLKAWPLYILPHHALSRLIFALTRIESSWHIPFTKLFVWVFKVKMSEALHWDIAAYASFNAFFTRALQADARPLSATGIVSPADGAVSQVGKITYGSIFQAKGHSYSVEELFGGDSALARPFFDGQFMTIYLSPSDYHRVHMPWQGQLKHMIHVPGRLFSVAQHTVNTIPKLFARNERVVCIFETDIGPMAMVLVGAINVAAIETVWAGLVTPPGKSITRQNYGARSAVSLQRGEEMGRFNMGSTVILLFGNDALEWQNELPPGQKLQMGQKIAELKEIT